MYVAEFTFKECDKLKTRRRLSQEDDRVKNKSRDDACSRLSEVKRRVRGQWFWPSWQSGRFQYQGSDGSNPVMGNF